MIDGSVFEEYWPRIREELRIHDLFVIWYLGFVIFQVSYSRSFYQPPIHKTNIIALIFADYDMV